jgi:hypothetical protein
MNGLMLEGNRVCDPRRRDDIQVSHVTIRRAIHIGDGHTIVSRITGLHVGEDQRGVGAIGEVRPIRCDELLPPVSQGLGVGGRDPEGRGGADDVGLASFS